MLGDGLAGSCATLAKHRRQVARLRIDLLLAACLAGVAFELLRCDDGVDVESSVVDHVVCRCKVALLKSVLRRTVTSKEMGLKTTLLEAHRLVVILELLFILCSKKSPGQPPSREKRLKYTYQDHFAVLRGVLVDSS